MNNGGRLGCFLGLYALPSEKVLRPVLPPEPNYLRPCILPSHRIEVAVGFLHERSRN